MAGSNSDHGDESVDDCHGSDESVVRAIRVRKSAPVPKRCEATQDAVKSKKTDADDDSELVTSQLVALNP